MKKRTMGGLMALLLCVGLLAGCGQAVPAAESVGQETSSLPLVPDCCTAG